MFLPLVDVFGDDDVTQLFSEESIVGVWLEVERALAHAQADAGVIPAEAAAAIDTAAVPGRIDLERLRERSARRRLSDPAAPRADRAGLPRGGPAHPLGSDHPGHHGHRPRAPPRPGARPDRRRSSMRSATSWRQRPSSTGRR